MAKKLIGLVKLQLEAGKATPAPPVGTALSQYMVKSMQFVKEYNEQTAQMMGTVVPVEISIYADSSFTFILKSPPATTLIKKALGIEKGSSNPGIDVAAEINQEQLREIAETKKDDFNAESVEAAMRIVAGTARSMGISVKGDDKE